MKKARGIVRYGIGVDTIDLAAAKSKGIKVANVREYGADIEVADHTLALFLAVKRRIVMRDNAIRAGAWQVGQKEPIGRIGGSTLGIVGFGRIGRAVLARFRAFGITRCLVHDPFLSPGHVVNDGIELSSLDALAAASDIITLHAPSTPINYHCINAHFISLMKPNSILVNTARGSLVDEVALHDALSTGRILGAGLDVFEREPPQSNPLLTLSNVVVSDHAAWYSEATVKAIQAGAAEQARQIMAGETPTNWVNP
jgi:D-3-phosphoglycerate dehydrogenase